ncbi:MAG TPA: sodium-dependent bicarbonate transport family permease [Leptospiraceae bacterium]|nr:sodium-dependent bicarbonate transport family permease [Leptospiraceae bacterium]HMY65091.1 sodium-dependent bicarbonate transport family permease [Leptospiraceae bacterium]HNF12703.1 sodium-dependent bicarbonate transport family permease [Leptospiraceae bacterium]HNF23483.1 sodium-dependent bicarbonate transport family permease [Leptospiraceae bacterium]HNI95456.1 sodium-dependent bicarbonate transport family permease [Leptospiraceae bacterium]
MDFKSIFENFLNPPVMFFFLGLLAMFLKSNLTIPDQLSKFFSMYLLFSIGFKGGHELYSTQFSMEHVWTLFACTAMAVVVPLYSYFLFRTKLDVHNSAALAGSFGSVSAVTFVTAGSFLHNKGLEYGGFIVAGLALMESPAIIIAVILDRVSRRKDSVHKETFSWRELIHEAFLGDSVFLLMGALVVGYVTGEAGWKAEKPFTEELFKGFLSFFLLDMGLSAAKRFKELKSVGFFLVFISFFLVFINATLGIILTKLVHMPVGDALMFTVLCASASYIAVPAAMKMSIPQANPSIYLSVALSMVFPFNIIVGIPIYYYIISNLA